MIQKKFSEAEMGLSKIKMKTLKRINPICIEFMVQYNNNTILNFKMRKS